MGEDRWLPIETAPKDGRSVILYWPPGHFGVDEHAGVGSWRQPGPHFAEHWCHQDRWMPGGDPTLWQPLPDAPALPFHPMNAEGDWTMGETEWSDAEIEEERQRAIEQNGELSGDPVPGSFYCHEALHMTSFLCSAVDTELCGHPAIAANPEWHRMAMAAHQKLANLYQMIGAAHLPANPAAQDPALSRDGGDR